MLRKAAILTLIFLLLAFFSPVERVFAASQAAEYICELGVAFYRLGKYSDALEEFNKVLLIEPQNQTAKKYINTIFLAENPPSLEALEKIEKPGRDQMISSALAQYSGGDVVKDEAKKESAPPVKLGGEARLGLGITSKDVIWKEANADRGGVPREKSWRYLWGDQRQNTYDPKIFNRLTLNLDTNFDTPLNGFIEVTADPWTFIGKNHVTVNSGTDSVDMDLKYWSADSRIINETYRSRQGQIVRLDQIKVVDGKTTLSRLKVAPTNAPFGASMDPISLKREYRPLRKAWVDYAQADTVIKVFPISDEFEAFTSDDPLKISNNHVYWEESPWLDQYEPSRTFDSAGSPIKKGRWVHNLSFFAKDSSDDYPHRLTFLRGASVKINPGDYSFEATAAAPMALWDDYQSAKNLEGAARLKIPFLESAGEAGLTSATKLGMRGHTREALNQAQALDLKYNLSDALRAYGEIAQSYTSVEEANGYDNEYNGFGAKIGFNYDESEYKTDGVYRGGLYAGYMESDFSPGLSNYRYTRRDEPNLSRHIYFSKAKDEDKALIWGDGIDRGRQVLGGTINFKGFEENFDSGINYRTVRSSKGKYVESVLRAEGAYKITPRLASKILGYYQNLPKTKAGYDPLIYTKTMYSLTDYFSDEEGHPQNADVLDGKDPSVGSFGGGLKYDLVENIVSLEGVYERTNDPLDFPRGLFNDLSVSTDVVNNQTFDKLIPFLYDQKFFGLPPYNYYSIAKSRLIFTPGEQWEIILGYTYNENKHATGIDNNINHGSFETTYKPMDKWTLWFKYIYSRVIDVYKQNQFQSNDFFDKHHNFFFGTEYNFSKEDSFTLLYGEFVGYNDPYEQSNWSLSTLDTQHIFRLSYKRKF